MDRENSMVAPLASVVVKHPKDAFISQQHLDAQWRNYNYLTSPNYDEALKEFTDFEDVLRQYVQDIYYLPKTDIVGLDSIYTHDPVKFTSKGAIILNSGKENRRNEAIAYQEYLKNNNFSILGELQEGEYADGGDLVWIDDKTLAIGLGYRTNQKGIERIKSLTKDFITDWIVVPLPHDQGVDNCLHLMSMISMVDKDLAVTYAPLMPVFFRQWLESKEIEMIDISKKEYNNLGCNVLALKPRECLIVKGNPETKKKLESYNCIVHEYKGKEISYVGTGGPTCLTAPIVRHAEK